MISREFQQQFLPAAFLARPRRRLLSWRVSYSGLSSPITWAEFRGPDIEGADSAIVSINSQIEADPHPGGATLTTCPAACGYAAGTAG